MICEQKSPESNNHVSDDSFCENLCENQQSPGVKEEYNVKVPDCYISESPASVILRLQDKSLNSSNSGNTNTECVIFPTEEIIDIDHNCQLNSPSLDHDNSLPDGNCDDYEMISVSSWDIDLSISGDEDAIEDQTDEQIKENDKKSEMSTPQNSPNIICCSAKTTAKSLEESMFFRQVCLKRRNAVRHECSYFKSKPTWSLHRPENNPCLHSRICPDADCFDSPESERGVTIDYFNGSDDHSINSIMAEFRNDAIYGDSPQFTSYSNPINSAKNRYSDIPCIEESRVKLIRNSDLPSPMEDSLCLPSMKMTDYIHANWVDGYRQKNAFICTQGPLSTTASDFWHMIVQYRAPIIVMTTRPREQNRDKCFQYWPENVGETTLIEGPDESYEEFEVTSLRSKEFGPHCPKMGKCEYAYDHWYRVTLLEVKNCRTGQLHRVNHFYFHSWPDQGIPHSTKAFLHFILQIRRTYRLNIAKLDYESEMDQQIPPPPIVVHCSAGIGRTGTYVVTEICTKSLSDCGRFNLYQTMLKVRSQRYKCVQNCHQYIYCRNAIIDYARQFGLLEGQNEKICSEDEEEDDDEEMYEDEDDDNEDEEEFNEHDFEEEEYEEQEVDSELYNEHEIEQGQGVIVSEANEAVEGHSIEGGSAD